MENNIILPRKDEDGNSYISYSQINAWNEKFGYNTKLPGKQEYMLGYFLGKEYESGPFAEFGTHVEDYITERKSAEFFDDAEKAVLEKIEPLGIFQYEAKLQFNDFYLKGFIDDTSPDYSFIRDYKTASEKSSQKYYGEDYKQLDIYNLFIKQKHGKSPDKMEVCIIERTGNGFKGGRGVLKVGGRVWYVERKSDDKRLLELEKHIIKTVEEISEYYKVFLELNKI